MVGADKFFGQFNDAVGRSVSTIKRRSTLLGDVAGRGSGGLGIPIATDAPIP